MMLVGDVWDGGKGDEVGGGIIGVGVGVGGWGVDWDWKVD